MAKICVFYASEKEAFASALVDILKGLYDVVWDKNFVHGKFHENIEPLIRESRAAVVLWDKHSVKSECVAHSEAVMARDMNVPVFNVRLDDSRVPIPFNNEVKYELIDWRGNSDHSGLIHLIGMIRKEIGHLPDRLVLDRRDIPLPCFFASVSSHETQLTPLAALQVAGIIEAPHVLVSAYDICFQSKNRPALDVELIDKILGLQNNDSIILLDSGNYESTRKKCSGDEWTLDLFHKVLTEAPFDFAFSFDNPAPLEFAEKPEMLAQFFIEQARRDNTVRVDKEIFPILHAPGTIDEGYSTNILPDIFVRVSEVLRPLLIAIPERELGDGLWKKVETVKMIRESLNRLPWYQPIHLLGTGNPLSLACLALAGADSFDGLEWLRTCVDRTNGCLYHYQQFSLFDQQHKMATKSAIIKAAVEAPNDEISYGAKVALHNLDFMAHYWTTEVATYRKAGTLHNWLRSLLLNQCSDSTLKATFDGAFA